MPKSRSTGCSNVTMSFQKEHFIQLIVVKELLLTFPLQTNTNVSSVTLHGQHSWTCQIPALIWNWHRHKAIFIGCMCIILFVPPFLEVALELENTSDRRLYSLYTGWGLVEFWRRKYLGGEGKAALAFGTYYTHCQLTCNICSNISLRSWCLYETVVTCLLLLFQKSPCIGRSMNK